MNNFYKHILPIIFMLCSLSNLYSNIINVPALHYPTIQAGIDSSSHGDTVLVAPGTYYENINFTGKNIVLCSQFIFSSDTNDIVGTVIDGNANGCVVVFENGEDSTAVISGFTITNGYVRLKNNRGGGITCLNRSSPRLSSLHIRNNNIEGDPHENGGAGIYCKGRSNPFIDNVKISDNIANGCDGGAILCSDSSSIRIRNTIIRQNRAIFGTITAFDSWFKLDNVIIDHNRTSVTGGGIHLERSNAVIKNSEITNNHVRVNGGGLFSLDATFLIDSTLLSNNDATEGFDVGEGGGVFLIGNSIGTVKNSIISHNIAQESGGGISINSSEITLHNVNINNNKVGIGGGNGGGIYAESGAKIILQDVRIFDNYTPLSGAGIYYGIECEAIYFESVSIFHNIAEKVGGGIYCASSTLNFSTDKLSSIYLNKAHEGGADIANWRDNIIPVYLDSFTVSKPGAYHLYPLDKFEISIKNPLFESVDADLYVSPDGSDSNRGTSPSEPLKSVNAALAFATTDSARQRYIHLASGTYSPSLTGEHFPLYGRSFVSVIGPDPEHTIIDGENKFTIFRLTDKQNFRLKNLTVQNAYSANSSIIRARQGRNIAFENLIVKDITGTGIFLGGGPQNFYILKNVQLTNISLDSTASQGAALWLSGAKANLFNLTISDNIANNSQEYCGLFLNSYSEVNLVNSIIYNNLNKQIIFGNYFIPAPSLTIAYSNIQGGREGISTDSLIVLNWLDGNIDEDPLFIGDEPYNYHLKPGSPCIDAGTAFLELEGDTIIDYSPEEYNGLAPDMGAFGINPVDFVVKNELIPNQFQLYQNYPNPFNNTTTISYRLAKPGHVNLSIYDITGQLVQVLDKGKKLANTYKYIWNASGYASGIYFVRLTTDNHTAVRKMLLVK